MTVSGEKDGGIYFYQAIEVIMTKANKNAVWSALLLASIGLYGCGGGGGSSTGALSLAVTDAPVDGVAKVVIEFSEVQVHSASGDTLDFVLPTPQQIDLLAYTSGKSTLLLDHQPMEAGQYQWIRLFVSEADSYVMTDSGAQLPLQIPSNAQSGLKLNHSFTLAANGVASFVIDFNLRQSLHLPQAAGSPYILRPTLRIADTATTGAISGSVDAGLVTAQGCVDGTATNGDTGGAVYVYEGSTATPVDINTSLSDGQPLTTAQVTQNNGAWEYTAAYLDPGAYTVAFSCQSTLDLPDATDSIVFHNPAGVTVTSGDTSLHDFP